MNKKVLWAVVIIAVLVIAILVFFSGSKSSSGNQSNKEDMKQGSEENTMFDGQVVDENDDVDLGSLLD